MIYDLLNVQKHQDDCDVLALWLANTCCLLNLLKQYSGEKVCYLHCLTCQ